MMCLTLLFVLTGLTSGLTSAEQAAGSKPITYIDNYDDLHAGAEISSSKVGTYHGLAYKGWTVSTNSKALGSNGGIVAHSEKNLASPKLPPFGTNSIKPANKVKCFDLVSFYFACSVLTTPKGQVSIAQGCDIAVRAFSGNEEIPAAPFDFVHNSETKAHMILAQLPPRFKCITNATFGISASATTPRTTVLKVDDLKHVNVS